jgi:hypothetical protein
MCASGAKYGIMTAHFYWIGAVPAMLFVGVFMMPFYYGSKARSVPEYLKLRFDEKTRGLNAITFADHDAVLLRHLDVRAGEDVPTWCWAGISTLRAALGRHRARVYTYLGGLTSAIYNEVLQFFLIVIGFSPLAILAVQPRRRLGGIQQKLPDVMTHAWKYVGRRPRIPWASKPSDWSPGSASCCRSATGAPTSSSSSAPWRPKFHVRRAPHAAAGRVPENDHAVHRDPARHCRAGAHENAGSGYALPPKVTATITIRRSPR